MIKLMYTDDDERLQLIEKYNNLFLVEDWDIREGKFLLFSDTEPIRELSEIEVLKNTILELSDELSGGIL